MKSGEVRESWRSSWPDCDGEHPENCQNRAVVIDSNSKDFRFFFFTNQIKTDLTLRRRRTADCARWSIRISMVNISSLCTLSLQCFGDCYWWTAQTTLKSLTLTLQPCDIIHIDVQQDDKAGFSSEQAVLHRWARGQFSTFFLTIFPTSNTQNVRNKLRTPLLWVLPVHLALIWILLIFQKWWSRMVKNKELVEVFLPWNVFTHGFTKYHTVSH